MCVFNAILKNGNTNKVMVSKKMFLSPQLT